MANNNQFDGGTDFSNFMKKPESPKMTPQSPIQEYQKAIRFTKRMKYLVLVLVVLAVAQVALILVTTKNKGASIPEGYRLVTPTNQPPYVEPIK